MIPFYIFYSMFGFQRTGDQIWALADARGRGLHDGRDRRPDDARRRGPPARRRPLAHPRVDRPERAAPTTRPTPTSSRLIVRDGIERMYVEGRGRLLLRHALQRELRPAGEARRHRRRAASGASTGFARHPTSGGRRSRRGWSGRARSSSRSWRPRSCSPRSSGSRRRSTRRRRSRCCGATRSRPSAGTGSTRPRRRGCPTSPQSSGRTAARSSPRPTG